MPNPLATVAQVLNDLRALRLVDQFAIGGAYAVSFHSEPLATRDLDVFCHLRTAGLLIDLSPLYAYLEGRGYHAEGDAVLIEGIPVQFLPAPTRLVDEAIENAVELSIEGAMTRVIDLEYIIGIALDLGRTKDKLRLDHLLSVTSRPIDQSRLNDILRRHVPEKPKAGEDTLLDRWRRFLEARGD